MVYFTNYAFIWDLLQSFLDHATEKFYGILSDGGSGI